MKQIFVLPLTMFCLLANAQITTITPGTKAPAFDLPGVDGREISFASFPQAKGYIIVFTCNTCPVAQRYEQRIIDLNAKYAPLGYPVIAINPNDPELASGDSYDAMKERAKAKHYQFPYLFDKGQKITDAYGAKSTPHIFLVQKTNDNYIVVYTGAIDNDPEDDNASRTVYIDHAINDLSTGKTPDPSITRAIGCSVKRKKA